MGDGAATFVVFRGVGGGHIFKDDGYVFLVSGVSGGGLLAWQSIAVLSLLRSGPLRP